MTQDEINELANEGSSTPSKINAEAGSEPIAVSTSPHQLFADAERAIKPEQKSTIPGGETAKELFKYIPEGAEPLAIGAAGALAGRVGRSFLPQEKVYGTPEYFRKQDANAADMRGEGIAARDARNANLTADNASANYQTRAGTLADQNSELQKANTAAQEALETARQNHRYAQTLDPAEEFARRRGLSLGDSSTPMDLTREARGGSGTAAYAEKFGATPLEARNVPSMSAMQQQNIPTQASAWNKIEPSFQKFSESPLVLGPEGQRAVAERAARQGSSAAEGVNIQKQIAAEIARHKAETQFQLENATKAADESRRAAANSARELAGHTATPAVSPAQASAKVTAAEALAEAQRIAKLAKPSLLSRIGTIGAKAVPFAGAALSPLEMMQAKEDYEKGNYGRAITHGLGAAGALAQASGIPPLMALGTAAQIPAMGLGAYDLYNEYARPSAPQTPPR